MSELLGSTPILLEVLLTTVASSSCPNTVLSLAGKITTSNYHNRAEQLLQKKNTEISRRPLRAPPLTYSNISY